MNNPFRFTLLIPLLLSTAPVNAVVLLFEDFEDATLEYTSSVPDNGSDAPSGDYYGRIHPDSFSPPAAINLANRQGRGYYGAQDTDGVPGGVDLITLSFTGIDISGFSNLAFSIWLAEDDAADGNEDWDSPSSLLAEASIDGGARFELLAVEGSGTNTAPRIDADFDGIGEGVEITSTFTSFMQGIGGSGSNLDLFLSLSFLDAGDEDIAFDNLMVVGDPLAAQVPEPGTAGLFLLAVGGLCWSRRKVSSDCN